MYKYDFCMQNMQNNTQTEQSIICKLCKIICEAIILKMQNLHMNIYCIYCKRSNSISCIRLPDDAKIGGNPTMKLGKKASASHRKLWILQASRRARADPAGGSTGEDASSPGARRHATTTRRPSNEHVTLRTITVGQSACNELAWLAASKRLGLA